MMSDRLTRLIDGFVFGSQIAVNSIEWNSAKVKELADYLIANGVIVPPCKVGDTLYEPTDRGTISEYEVLAVRVELFSTFVEWKIKEGIVWRYVHEINSNEIGRTVFLTHEEAERALSNMKAKEENK